MPGVITTSFWEDEVVLHKVIFSWKQEVWGKSSIPCLFTALHPPRLSPHFDK